VIGVNEVRKNVTDLECPGRIGCSERGQCDGYLDGSLAPPRVAVLVPDVVVVPTVECETRVSDMREDPCVGEHAP
jgi:hypothetical protein